MHSDMLTRRAHTTWRRAGLEPTGLHECRHTYAAFMIAAGVTPRPFRPTWAIPRSRSPSTATGTSCPGTRRRPRRCWLATSIGRPERDAVAVVAERHRSPKPAIPGSSPGCPAERAGRLPPEKPCKGASSDADVRSSMALRRDGRDREIARCGEFSRSQTDRTASWPTSVPSACLVAHRCLRPRACPDFFG